MDLFSKIHELKEFKMLSKHQQLVDGIINTIDAKILKKGDQLPSINQMVSNLGFARKTIVKAYEELKDRGIVESKRFLGYFIASEATHNTLKVALVLYPFHSYHEDFYNTFRSNLGKNIQLDLYFNDSNNGVLTDVINTTKNRYGMYVIAPFDNKETFSILKAIPKDKLLIVDRIISRNNTYCYIGQEFEKATYNALIEEKIKILKYKKIILCFNQKSNNPIGVLRGFEKFVKSGQIFSEVVNIYESSSLQKGVCYLLINDHELWNLIKDCRGKKLVIGKDVGVISHNDSPIKEIVCGGITTFSTNYNIMGKEAAEHVSNPQNTQKLIGSELISRNSI